jgi:hypothetical protein
MIQFSPLTELFTNIKIPFPLLPKTNLPKDLDKLHLCSKTTKMSYWQLKKSAPIYDKIGSLKYLAGSRPPKTIIHQLNNIRYFCVACF